MTNLELNRTEADMCYWGLKVVDQEYGLDGEEKELLEKIRQFLDTQEAS